MTGNETGRKGKPVGSRHRTTRMLDAFADKHAREILESTISAAVDGNLEAAALLLPYIWPKRKGGRVLPSIDLSRVRTPGDVVDAHGRIIAAVASGELTIEEGQGLAALVDRSREAIATATLAAEMDELRAAMSEMRKKANASDGT